MSYLAKYTVLTPGCAPHPAELYESDRLSQVTKPELVRQIIGGTFNQFASGPQIDACRRFMQATDQYIDTTDANHRSGFLLGDEMGVGKTNTIAISIVQTIQEHLNNHGTQGRHIAVVPKEALFEPLQTSISNMASVTSTNINFLRIKDIFKRKMIHLLSIKLMALSLSHTMDLVITLTAFLNGYISPRHKLLYLMSRIMCEMKQQTLQRLVCYFTSIYRTRV